MGALSELPVGTKISLNVSGVAKNFIIVHQGLPSTAYDSSCNGTWLLMEDIYTTQQSQTNVYYSQTNLYSYLKNTFIGYLDQEIQTAIKTVTLPYTADTGEIANGANGISSKVFALSATEVGCVPDTGYFTFNIEGSVLSYFKVGNSTTEAKQIRIAYYNGSAKEWWLRTFLPKCIRIYTSGGPTTGGNSTATYSVRPAFILPSDMIADNMIVESPINGSIVIGGTTKEISKAHANIGGVWKDISSAYTNVNGIWKPTS